MSILLVYISVISYCKDYVVNKGSVTPIYAAVVCHYGKNTQHAVEVMHGMAVEVNDQAMQAKHKGMESLMYNLH